MPNLTAERFPEFFNALWQYSPFTWQSDLANRVLNNNKAPWPDAIALPTASGKTACLDIAVYALAAQADEFFEGGQMNAPRRIFFVVDRRVIVDEAFERARRLARKLQDAKEGILKEVSDRLRRLSGGEVPLACFQLRGGMYRSDAWARSPLQATIIASTVDQYGSRLLFRGYGRSFKAWPIHAGLAGNDAMVLLDEAHCALPFMETLQSVRRYRAWAKCPLAAPFHVSIMSATPPSGLTDVFRDTSDEPTLPNHPLGARQLVNKLSRLISVQTSRSDAIGKLAKALAVQAETLAGEKPKAVVIFANRVATVRETHRILAEKHGERAILLTGRMRSIDKDDTVAERLSVLSADKSFVRQLDAPIFVVATQTLEVGANLDFDILVTECASLDALRQRFGRLNRMGRKVETPAAILMRSDQSKQGDDDPVYGEALANTWQWLVEQAGEGCIIDMGIAALENRLSDRELIVRLNAPTNHAPVMFPAHVDCWSQTSPEPFPTPDVSVFLHGPGKTPADVQVCWRADIDLTSPERSMDILALCPPAAAECLPVPIRLMRQWLVGEKVFIEHLADVEGIAELEDKSRAESLSVSVRKVLRWCGRDDMKIISEPSEVHPGDVVVIPTSENGMELGDFPGRAGGSPILDWGDRAYTLARAKAMLRLNPQLIKQWPESLVKTIFLEFAENAEKLFSEDHDALIAALRDSLSTAAYDENTPRWLQSIVLSLYDDPFLKRKMLLHPFGGFILTGSRRMEVPGEEPDNFNDEDDASSSGTAPIDLDSHHHGVSAYAKHFGKGCGVSAPLIDAFERAGLLHDLGKADTRFQALLNGGNPWVMGKLLAKSARLPQGRSAFIRACRSAGYPDGWRHELLSVRLAESATDLLPEDLLAKDLVLHLVAIHHGRCRPFAPVVSDKNPVQVSIDINNFKLTASSKTKLERIDSGVSDRFWRLTRLYGWWGLAWLEAIFRLADHRRSEMEQTSTKGVIDAS